MSSALTVLPMSQEIKLNPGERIEGSITIANPASSTEDFEYVATVSPYNVVGEDYTLDLSANDATQIVNWIRIYEPEGSVKPNESKELKFRIKVPKDAPAGGQYAMITVRSKSATQEGEMSFGIQDVFEMGSIIYGRVSGQTVRKGEILGNSIPGFSTVTPVTVSYQVSNNGNIHEKAIQTLTVKNVFTGEQVFPKDDETNRFSEYIMPSSTRYLTRTLDRLSNLGVYEVHQTIEYLGETSDVTQVLIVCPLWFLMLVIATFIALVATIVRIFKKHHKKSKQEVL